MSQQTRERPQASSSGARASVASSIAADAYLFGYPLVLMDAARRRATAVARPTGSRAPVNQLAHLRWTRHAPESQLDILPEVDTLTSIGWLDLGTEPMVLRIPSLEARYCLVQLVDAWTTNVLADRGTRSTASNRADLVITGPSWEGTLSAGLERVEAPTNLACLIIRIRTTSNRDCVPARALQRRFTLTPLGGWRTMETPVTVTTAPASPDIDATPSLVDELARIEAGAFFTRLNTLLLENPASQEDAGELRRFATIGVGPGRALDPAGLDPALTAGLENARSLLAAEARRPQGMLMNGWDVPIRDLGRYSTDYLGRAVAAITALGATLQEDILCLRATTDSRGNQLTGRNQYQLSFAPGRLPPVQAFWSLTMYDRRGALVRNPLGRYAIGDLDETSSDGDGALSVLMQRDRPGSDKESSWLPAPEGAFCLVLRLYRPTQDALAGNWRPPMIERIG